MLLSIIIPVFNSEKHLPECLDSILNQNVSSEFFEIVCINDGSTDNSLQLLEAYAKKHPNMVVLDQSNSGVSVARNNAINHAQGKYIWFVDSDDFISPGCFQQICELLTQDLDIINFNGYSFAEKFSPEEATAYQNNQLVGNMTYWGYACTHIYMRDLIVNNHITFRKEIKYGEDEMFYNDVFTKSSNIVTLDNTFYMYRIHSSSAMNKSTDIDRQKKRIDSIIRSMCILKTGIENGKYTKAFSAQFLQERYRLCLACLANLAPKDSAPYFKELSSNNLLSHKAQTGNQSPTLNQYKVACFKLRLRRSIRKLIPDFCVAFLKTIIGKKKK